MAKQKKPLTNYDVQPAQNYTGHSDDHAGRTSELIAIASAFVVIFPGVMLYLSYHYLNVFFSISGIYTEISPVRIGDALDLFKRYIPFTSLYMLLLFLFTIHGFSISLNSKVTIESLKIRFSPKGNAFQVSLLIFAVFNVFFFLAELQFFHTSVENIIKDQFVLWMLYLVYIMCGIKIRNRHALNVPIIAICCMAIFLYQSALGDAARASSAFIMSDKNQSLVMIKNQDSPKKIFLVLSDGALYIQGDTINFAYKEQIVSYSYLQKADSKPVH